MNVVRIIEEIFYAELAVMAGGAGPSVGSGGCHNSKGNIGFTSGNCVSCWMKKRMPFDEEPSK